jgi:hypothetical protein
LQRSYGPFKQLIFHSLYQKIVSYSFYSVFNLFLFNSLILTEKNKKICENCCTKESVFSEHRDSLFRPTSHMTKFLLKLSGELILSQKVVPKNCGVLKYTLDQIYFVLNRFNNYMKLLLRFLRFTLLKPRKYHDELFFRTSYIRA